MLDAYTLKKVLPRLVIAIILVNLSWDICRIIIEIVNVLGQNIAGIILSTGSGSSATISDLGGGWQLLFGGASVAAGIAVIGTAGFIAVPLLLSLLSAVFVGFITLTIRQLAIVVLVIISPIALVLWVFPGMDKWGKRWFDTFTKVLLMYPLVMGIIATGSLLSGLFAKETDGAGPVIAMIIKFIPYFLIPFTAKIAGGLFGQLTGVVNDRSKGLIDRGKKAAYQKSGQNWQKAKGGGLYQKAGFSALNRPLSAIGAANTMPWNYRKGRINASRETNRTIAAAQLGETDKTFQANKVNDQFLLAVADENRAKASLNSSRAAAVAATAAGDTAKAAKHTAAANSWEQAIGLAQTIPGNPTLRSAAALELSKTGYQLDAGQAGYNQLASMMASATGAELEYEKDATGNLVLDRNGQANVIGAKGRQSGAWANAMDNGQYNLKNAGRFDLGGINRGAGYSFEGGVGKASGYMLGNGKPDNYEAGAEHALGTSVFDPDGKVLKAPELADNIHNQIASGSLDVNRLGAWHAKLLDAKQGATGANKDAINNQLEAIRGAVDRASPQIGPPLNQAAVDLKARVMANEYEIRRAIDPNLIET